MEFNTLVKARLFPILQKYGFEITEEFKNIIRFKSSVVKVNVVFNEYDKSYFVEIGKQQEDALYPLNDDAIKELWGYELPIQQVTSETFIQNLSTLFKTKEGVEILNGNVKPLKGIINQQSENYTSELQQKQILEAASKAWEANDYVSYVESIDKIGVSKIPQSYKLKYKMAKQKL